MRLTGADGCFSWVAAAPLGAFRSALRRVGVVGESCSGEVGAICLVAYTPEAETRGALPIDPNRAIAPAEIIVVQRDIGVQGAKLEQDIASGVANRKAIVAAATSRQNVLKGQAAELMLRYAQAAADAAVMPVSPNGRLENPVAARQGKVIRDDLCVGGGDGEAARFL